MENPKFDERVHLKILPIPGVEPELMALFVEGHDEGTLGNLVQWITTGVDPAKRPYFRLIRQDGEELEYPAIEAISRDPDFAA